MSDRVLLEGRVVTKVISYIINEYLYTGTVCRSWRENVKPVYTDLAVAFESTSRIQEAVENGIYCQCPRQAGENEPSCDFLMEYAEIVDADVAVFKKIHDMGYDWGDFTMQNAAIGHKIDIVKFMHQHGCPLNNSVLFNAANSNCLELVEYLAEHECPIDVTPIEIDNPERFDFNVRSLEQAIAKNFLDVVKCLRTKMNFPFCSKTFRTACNADYPGNIDTLVFLHSEGCVPDQNLFFDLINDGNYGAVKFMLTNHLHHNKHSVAMCITVANFQPRIVKLLADYQFEIDSDVVDLATYDMALLRWLIRIGGESCKLTPNAYINTLEYDMDHASCIDTLDCLHTTWKLGTGFRSMDELMQNERWSAALDERDQNITEWFKHFFVSNQQ
ncbi:unnamed protein product [Hapterophycus canaliculatus]